MRENEPAAAFDADDATESPTDRRARAARIRRRSRELIDALGADHPLVAEALARADALDEDPQQPSGTEARTGDGDGTETIDLRSSAESTR